MDRREAFFEEFEDVITRWGSYARVPIDGELDVDPSFPPEVRKALEQADVTLVGYLGEESDGQWTYTVAPSTQERTEL